MTIEYSVSKDGLRIENFPKGVLNIKETVDYFLRLEDDKEIKQGTIEMVFFKYATDFNLSYLQK